MNGFNQGNLKISALLAIIIVFAVAALLVFQHGSEHRSQLPENAAKLAGKVVKDFPQTVTHMLDEINGGITLTEDERKGRTA